MTDKLHPAVLRAAEAIADFCIAVVPDEAYHDGKARIAALIDRETHYTELVEAYSAMLENYVELKRISLIVAKSDAPNWIGAGFTVEDDIHVQKARALLDRIEKP